ncbi:MAG: hypothetical protein R3E39_10290 [Anaerolineae bacterium]
MKTVQDLDAYTRYWFERALKWSDARWSDEHNLLTITTDHPRTGRPVQPHIVRDSVWYAMGLLMRQQDGDVERALATIEAVLSYQFDEPEAVYHGTFYRYVGEPHPPTESAVIWKDYDPNWREFICTVFILLLKDFDALLPAPLQDKIRRAIQLAAEGAFGRKVAAEYTNISLMSAYLLDYAGAHYARTDWRKYALEQANKIYALFNRFKTFNEYNSPTYYGVDFYALALWREYGSTPEYRQMGAEMEAELWRDTVQFYHAGMRNLCGPYDRSYGMDMTDYLALVGLWMGAVLPADGAPLPDSDYPFDHAADYFFMPLVALVGSKPPADVLPHMQAFQGERMLERTIEPQRTATAWLSDTLMLGAEADALNPTRTDQFHPATAHWIAPDGTICWIRARCETLVQAVAKPHTLELSSSGNTNYVFEIRVPNPHIDMIEEDKWTLPGMTVHIDRPNTSYGFMHIGDLLQADFESDAPIKLIFSP